MGIKLILLTSLTKVADAPCYQLRVLHGVGGMGHHSRPSSGW